MPKSQLLQLVESGDYEQFDSRCLELISARELRTSDLVGPVERLIDTGQGERVAALGPMVFENLDWEADPQGNVGLAKAVMAADVKNEAWRDTLLKAYTTAYQQVAGFDQILSASGLTQGRAFRVACKVLDLGLTLEIGSFLVNRMDDRAAEVVEIDRPNGLFTLKRESRSTTIPAAELARSYDLADANDFRVLRQLQPERLTELIDQDPVALVTGLLHAHGAYLDQDQLRDELVPRYLDAKSWTKWWTKARAKLKRSKHIVMEGRAPVVLSYSKLGRTLEDDARDAFEAAKDPHQWLKIIDDYLREKAIHKEEPDGELLSELHDWLVNHAAEFKRRRPGDALGAALVVRLLADKGMPVTEGSRGLASRLLTEAEEPLRFIKSQEDASLWPPALDALREAYADDYGKLVVRLLGHAPFSQLDRIAEDAIAAGELNETQKWIEKALDRPIDFPNIMYWLWKGPQQREGLHIPSDELLLSEILDTLFALGRSLTPEAKVMREFRQRMRAALALKGYGKVVDCFKATEYGRGVTLKHQIERIEGLGAMTIDKILNLLRDQHPALWAKPIAKRTEAWEDEAVLYATDAGIKRRAAARDEIMNVQMRENAKRIGDAAAMGDLSENSEYKFALEERDFLRAQLAQINNELSIAEPIEPKGVETERVSIGTRVTLRASSDGSERAMTFLGPFDTDVDAGIYNYKAPMAQKLMGLSVGDHVATSLDGADVDVEVVRIENALEQTEQGGTRVG